MLRLISIPPPSSPSQWMLNCIVGAEKKRRTRRHHRTLIRLALEKEGKEEEVKEGAWREVHRG